MGTYDANENRALGDMQGRLTVIQRVRRGVRRMLPRGIVRRIYRRQALRYISRLRPEYDPGKRTILAINHLFDQDLQALANANTNYNLIVLDFAQLFKGGKLYFSRAVRDIRAPYDSEPLEIRMRFREECRLLFERICARFTPRVILTANDNFAFIREFIHIAREGGVPTIILDKEGTISPHSFESEATRARELTPCISDHVYVWSQRQKAYWQKRGVEADRITVVGQPRSDLFFTPGPDKTAGLFRLRQPLVTLFSYFDTAYIPDEYVRRQGASWQKMKTESHDEFARFAKNHSDFNFVIKCHPQQLDIKAIRSKYETENLRVIGGADIANELIRQSELIIAFQTTAVIEAMFLNKRVLYTAWDTHCPALRNDLLPFHAAAGIVIADSFDRFRSVCARFFAGDRSDFTFSPEELAARDRFVDGYLYKPDGHVAERFFKELDRFLA